MKKKKLPWLVITSIRIRSNVNIVLQVLYNITIQPVSTLYTKAVK